MTTAIKLDTRMSEDRISRSQMYNAMAEIMSLRATCCRGKNGCVITQDNRIISTGYNGTIIPNADCETLGCDKSKKCIHAMHAERNAIAFAAKKGIALEGATMYVTSAPCYDCAMMIVQAGIKVVVYAKEYTTDGGAGLNLLSQMKVEVYQA